MSQKSKKCTNEDESGVGAELDADISEIRKHPVQAPDQPLINSTDRPRRERSPSAMSQSSAVLEWDPSADVGAMATAARISIPGSSTSRENQLRELANIESCQILFAPKFKATSELGLSRSSSRNSKSHLVCAYSTPSASPVPLESLQYSPVAPNDTGSTEQKSQDDLHAVYRRQNEKNCTQPANVEDSSGSNNNDEFSEDRRTPGRVVSEASTDWEYDNEKKVSCKYVADWQTHGITRSEIEYSNRKKSGSSTSMASSVYYMNVQGNSKTQCLASPEENMKKSDQYREDNSKAGSTDLSEMDRKVHNILKGASKSLPEVGSCESDPSSMCMIVDNFLKIMEEDSEKDGIQYDVLKTHRDYHMTKVWKQISKLERLNRALLSYKRKPIDRITSGVTQGASRRDLGIVQGVRNCVTIEDLKKLLDKYHEKDISPGKSVTDVKSKYGQELSDLANKPVQATQFERRKLKPGTSSKQETGVDEIIRDIVLGYFGGHSNPAFKSSSDCSEVDENRNPTKPKRSQKIDECPSANSKLRTGKSSVEVLSRYSKSRFRNNSSETTSSTGNETGSSYHKTNKNQASEPTYAALKELIAKLLVSETEHGQKQTFSKASQTKGIPARLVSKEVEEFRTPDGRGYESDPSITVRETGTNENLRCVINELLRWHSMSSRNDSDKPPIKATVKAVKKSPVGFFIPMFDAGNGFENSRDVPEKFNIKGPKPIQECLKERNPHCYKIIKERDDFLITIKRDRQIHNETLLREALEANMDLEDIDEYLKWNYRHGNEEEKKRLKTFWNLYMDSKRFRENKENEEVWQTPHVISSKEMKERTQRLRMNDHLMLAKQRKEAEERKKRASRILQRNFSTNLRQFQKSGGVNIPDRLKLGPRPN